MKVIFLDIDGVLNSTTDFLEASKYGHPQNQGTEVISPGKLALIEHLITCTDARIVISSSWKENFSTRTIYQMFVDRGFQLSDDVMYGKTPSLPSISPRGYEVLAWIEQHPEVTEWVVFDDIDEFTSLEEFEEHNFRFIQTNIENGINITHVNKAMNILGLNEEALKRKRRRDKAIDLLTQCIV